MVLNLTTLNWQRDTVQSYAANKGIVQIYYGAAVNSVFKTLNGGTMVCISPVLVEMVGNNAICDLEKKNHKLPLLEGIAETCGRFLC